VAFPNDKQQRSLRLVLVDQRALFRESLARLLASEQDLEIVAECGTPQEAFAAPGGTDADVFLVDIAVAREFMGYARKAGYGGKALVVAKEIDPRTSAILLSAGAAGIFLESDCSARLIQAVRFVATGEVWVDQKIIQLLADRYPQHDDHWAEALTPREQTVLRGIVDGLSNRKIGDRTGVSESTIKATLQHLFNKAGVRTRSQLVRIVLEGSRPGISQNGNAA
jgi:two-component system nitrate/nitrite response regulator NarL